ncbi:hypothetical protein ACWTU6_30145 [Mesorhizobium sp. BHbsci]
MLEKYYIRPATIDRIQESWIASTVEQYVGWMAERRLRIAACPAGFPSW